MSSAVAHPPRNTSSSHSGPRKGIGLPVTGFADSPDDTDDLLNLVGSAPVVVKLLQGTQGKGVVLAETRNAAESVFEAFRDLNANFLVQEFVKEAKVRTSAVSSLARKWLPR